MNRKGLNVTLFLISRNFYNFYPQMGFLFVPNRIYPTVSDESDNYNPLRTKPADNDIDTICATVSHKFQTLPEAIVSHLSFSYIRELLSVDDPLARYFYEQECIKCTWSVRELRRQINTNLYFRAGISSNPEKMLSLPSIQGHDSAELQIRQPFTFEFLGLKAQDVVGEHDLEDALISHLQNFILELGKGFCFESRQKRIIRFLLLPQKSCFGAKSHNQKSCFGAISHE